MTQSLIIKIPIQLPYDWQSMLSYLHGHGIGGVESVVGNKYLRTARSGKHAGWFSAHLEHDGAAPSLSLELSPGLIPVTEEIVDKAKHLFDTSADCAAIASHLGELALNQPGLRIAGAYDGLELAVRTILGQQVSVKAGNTMTARVAATLGQPIETDIASLKYLTPTAQSLAQAEISDFTALGIIAKRGATIISVAQAVLDGKLILTPMNEEHQAHEVAAQIAYIKSLPGIGDWTAQYLAIRVWRLKDAFPVGDLALRKALDMRQHKDKEIHSAIEKWRPLRSYAAMHLWKSMEQK